MTLIQKLLGLDLKFSFGKNNFYHKTFSKSIGAYSMHDDGYGLSIPTYMSPENQLRAVFVAIYQQKGTFVFNINGVDLEKATNGFQDFEEAYGNNMITEWELNNILESQDYYEKTIFHNGIVELNKTEIGIERKWK